MSDPFREVPYAELTHWGKLSRAKEIRSVQTTLEGMGFEVPVVLHLAKERLMNEYREGLDHQ